MRPLVQIHSTWVAWKTASKKSVLRGSQIVVFSGNLAAAGTAPLEESPFHLDLQAPQVNTQTIKFNPEVTNIQQQEPAETRSAKTLDIRTIKYKI